MLFFVEGPAHLRHFFLKICDLSLALVLEIFDLTKELLEVFNDLLLDHAIEERANFFFSLEAHLFDLLSKLESFLLELLCLFLHAASSY